MAMQIYSSLASYGDNCGFVSFEYVEQSWTQGRRYWGGGGGTQPPKFLKTGKIRAN